MKSKRSLLWILASVSLLTLLSFSGLVRAQDNQNGHEDMSEYGGMGDETPLTPEVSRLVADVRQGTAGFRDPKGIEDVGYSKFLDCFVNNNVGGMGQHY